MPSKKKNRRSNAKYPALEKNLNLKTRTEQIDFDYIDQLPEKWTDPKTGKTCNPKQYLNDFVNESIHADFKSNKRLHKKKKIEDPKNEDLRKLLDLIYIKVKELVGLIDNSKTNNKLKIKLKKSISKLKVQIRKQIKGDFSFIEDYFQKEAYDKNNSRNRCILTRAKAQGKAISIDDMPVGAYVTKNVEDEVIDLIDGLKLAQNLKDESDQSAD